MIISYCRTRGDARTLRELSTNTACEYYKDYEAFLTFCRKERENAEQQGIIVAFSNIKIHVPKERVLGNRPEEYPQVTTEWVTPTNFNWPEYAYGVIFRIGVVAVPLAFFALGLLVARWISHNVK